MCPKKNLFQGGGFSVSPAIVKIHGCKEFWKQNREVECSMVLGRGAKFINIATICHLKGSYSFFCLSAFLSFFWFFCIFVSLLWNKFQKVPSVQVYPVGFNRCPVYSLRKVWSHWAFLLHKKCGQGHSNHFARHAFAESRMRQKLQA